MSDVDSTVSEPEEAQEVDVWQTHDPVKEVALKLAIDSSQASTGASEIINRAEMFEDYLRGIK